MAIQNRYEFMYYVACTNANPNGDPDMGNMPRIDPQTMQGFITDGATKRRIRNYVELAHRGEPGMNIIVQQATNINRHIAEAKRAAGVEECAKAKEAVYAGRKKACELFYDVRTFGAVMSTGPNAGQVRGPVQITYGKSLDAVLPLDISITRMAVADKVKNGATVEDYAAWEQEQSEDKLHTMGRKQIIPFGLYEVRGFVSANLAEETGFDDEDLNVLFEATPTHRQGTCKLLVLLVPVHHIVIDFGQARLDIRNHLSELRTLELFRKQRGFCGGLLCVDLRKGLGLSGLKPF